MEMEQKEGVYYDVFVMIVILLAFPFLPRPLCAKNHMYFVLFYLLLTICYCEVNYLLRGEFFVVTALPEYQTQTMVTTLYQFCGYNLIVTTYTESACNCRLLIYIR